MFDFSVFNTAEGWISLLSLSAMEIVLGIDNIIFISILSSKLPPGEQPKARSLGLTLALVMRLGLLFTISWMMQLTQPLFDVLGRGVSGRDLILLVGGLFLVGKATYEIHDKLEVEHGAHSTPGGRASFAAILIQILLLDVVFSLDSVITAVGMAPSIVVMMLAMVIAVGVMLIFAGPISSFVEKHPTMKILALSFLLLIGVVLIADGLGQHISKGYIYFAMAFALAVEMINMRVRKAQQKPVELHKKYGEGKGPSELPPQGA
ncbi:MAG TPA: TerC family protein [Polyangiaceae bacterium]|nr:TerC family protein [Polyangiaceae bacterium]